MMTRMNLRLLKYSRMPLITLTSSVYSGSSKPLPAMGNAGS